MVSNAVLGQNYFIHSICRLSLAQIVMGSLCVLFGIDLLILELEGDDAYFADISYGIWIGAYVSALCVDYSNIGLLYHALLFDADLYLK